MKTKFWISLAVVTAITTLTFAAPPPAPLNHVPNELIVKFRPQITHTLQAQIESGIWPQGATLSPAINKAKRKYNLKDIRPLFRNFEQNRKALRDLNHKDKKLLSNKEKRILARLARADAHARVPDLSGIYKLKVSLDHGQKLKDVLKSYQSDPNVEYAELNYIVSTNNTPNDPLYHFQWSLDNTGQYYPYSGHYNTPPGVPDADIDAPEAWEDGVGSSEIIVAVVDSGIDYNHRDLQTNMWINSAELTGVEGLDDDNNGYVDDIYGYDFINIDGDPIDDLGHGTHCAGTIAAHGNNGLDIAGVCWNARIMALKFLGANGSGNTADATTAFYYAVENGADIISNSWGGGGFSQATQDAIDYASSLGAMLVASAGNNGLDYPQYPAYYDNVFSAAATNSLDNRAPFSSYGSWVDIAAPGVDILSLRAAGTSLGTLYDPYTTILSGTSMSCPHVAGACALMLSVDPETTAGEVEQTLTDSADAIDTSICASGRLNLSEALVRIISPLGRISLDAEAYSCQGTINIELRDSDLSDNLTQDVTVSTDGGDFETVALARRSSGLGVFNGSINIETASPNTGDGILQVAPAQIITVMYEDANDGTGAPATAADTAIVDCEPPTILDVQVGFPGRQPAISFETDEPTTGRVRCALSCGAPYVIEVSDPTLAPTHTIILQGVAPETRYYFIVDANDAAGNNTVDTNKGRCYKFTTTGPGNMYVPADFPTIQQAIDNSWDGGVVSVADGLYTGPGNVDLDFKGLSITVRSLRGAEHCIIDCNGGPVNPHRGFYFHSQEGANSVVEGFTITNGHIPGSWYVGIGGAILCFNNSSPTITDCVFINNSAGWDGGAICNLDGSPNIQNCTFVSNTAIGNDGGAINNETGTVTVANCKFTANSAYDWGGAIRNIISSGNVVSNCVFSGNRADDGGALFYHYDSNAIIDNCTLAGNTAPNGNAVATSDYGPENHIEITNSIFADGGNQILDTEVSILDVSYSNIPGLWPGAGNIDVDPCFVNPGYWDANDWIDGDYHLRSEAGRWDNTTQSWKKDSVTSLCIDAGDPNSDWHAEPWPHGSRVNMGAFGNTPHASKSLLVPQPVEAKLKLTPQTLNPSSKGKWLKARLTLPEGFRIQDVDADAPGTIEPLGVQSSKINVYINEQGLVEIEILFDRLSVSAAIPSGSIELTVVAQLADSRYVYGVDTLKINNHDFSILANDY